MNKNVWEITNKLSEAVAHEHYYQAYYDQVIFNLTPEQRANKSVYYNATQDLQYDLLNPEAMQYFMIHEFQKRKIRWKALLYDH